MFSITWPWALAALPLPLIVYFLLPKAKQQLASLKVPFFSHVESITHSHHVAGGSRSPLRLIVLSIIWLLLIGAAVNPQWTGDAIPIPPSGRDLLLAVDISGSMETEDMIVNHQRIQRIHVVKFIVGEFVERRKSDRIGLVLFGSNAYLQAPLTFDKHTVKQLLQEAQIGFAGPSTAIGDAIGLAIKRLRKRPESQRVLVLLTDGANTSGEVTPKQAADLAKQEGIKIYTVGLGATELEVRRGIFGSHVQTINPSAELDENTLSYIAETTGGRFFRATNPQELHEIYALLDTLEPIEQDADIYRPISALYYWPLGMALTLSFIFALFTMFYVPSFTHQTLRTSNHSSHRGDVG